MQRWRERVRSILVHGLGDGRALLIGAVLTGALSLALIPLEGHLGRPAQALLLVLPVALAAVVGGRRPAQATAALATLSFALVVPPRGWVAVEVYDDVVALAVFLVVAFAMGTLVAHRIEVLGQIERQRAALLRSVSHDLRTPLATISAAASVLSEDDWVDEASRRDLLDLVSSESARLDRLVGNLLSLARIEAGALEPRRQAVDLGELVMSCVDQLGAAAAPVDVAVAEDLPLVQADYPLVEQVVRNLLENAIRHNPPQGRVRVEAAAEGSGVRLVVADQGEGIPAELRHAVFEPFRTGATVGSSGIGLAICKAVVEAHGGTIAVGGPPSGGAELTVTLPLR